MKCPSCGSDEAYMGLSDIDCPNNLCKHNKHYQGGATVLNGSPPLVRGVMPPVPSFPSNPWGPTQGMPVIAPPNLSIRISKIQPRQNNVQVSFIASGDPGTPDKEVEIYFSVGNGDQLCTLSNPNVTFVGGVDADGTSVYTTNWLCIQDGVKPTDTFQLKATIN